MARIMEWRIVREKSGVEKSMCPLRCLGKHETPPHIHTGRVDMEVEIRNGAWIVEDDIRDLSGDMTHVVATERAACAAEMAGPTALYGEQEAGCLNTATSQNHGVRLNSRLAVGPCDHDTLDCMTVLAEVEIDDGAIQTERDPFRAFDLLAVNQREPGFDRPPLQRFDGHISTQAAQMPGR
jgi:hypothetical protein